MLTRVSAEHELFEFAPSGSLGVCMMAVRDRNARCQRPATTKALPWERPSGSWSAWVRDPCKSRGRSASISGARFVPWSDARIEQQYRLSVELSGLVRHASS
jgi:hypothetical protein